MKLPRLKNLSIWYPQSDMKLSLKSLENSFLNYTSFHSQAQTLTDVIRVSTGFLKFSSSEKVLFVILISLEAFKLKVMHSFCA